VKAGFISAWGSFRIQINPPRRRMMKNPDHAAWGPANYGFARLASPNSLSRSAAVDFEDGEIIAEEVKPPSVPVFPRQSISRQTNMLARATEKSPHISMIVFHLSKGGLIPLYREVSTASRSYGAGSASCLTSCTTGDAFSPRTKST
jgi:hypothetical protein